MKCYTKNCRETKEILDKWWQCCNICHDDPYEREMGVFENYTKFKDLLFEACCNFTDLEITDQEWKVFEKELVNR